MNGIAWILEGRAWADLRGPARFLVFCLVFFGIPLGLAHTAHEEGERLREQDLIEFRKAELENRLGIYNQWIPGLEGFERTLLIEWKRCSRSRESRKALQLWRARLKKWFLGAIEMEVLDSSGRRIESLCDHVLSERLLTSLHQDSRQDNYLSLIAAVAENLDFYRRELGPLFGRFSGKVINRMESLDIHGRWVASLISDSRSAGQLILLFRESRFWAEMIGSYRLQMMRENYPDMAVAAIDLRLPLERQRRSLGTAGRWLGELLRDPEANGGAPVAKGPWVMAQIPIQRHLRAVFALPLRPAAVKRKGESPGASLPITLFAVFCLASACGWRWFLAPTHPFVSLRWKLGLLLLYVVGLPLGLLGMAAHSSLREYRSLLEQRLWNRQERALQEIEMGFLASQGLVESTVHQELKQVAPQPGRLIPDLLDRIDRLFNEFNPQFCEVVNEKGKPLTNAYVNEKSGLKPLLGILQSFSSRVLADLNLGRGRSMSAKEQLMTATGEMIGMNMDLMYSAVSRYLGELTPLRIGPDLFQIFMQPVYDEARKARQIVIMGWDSSSLPFDFVRNLRLPIRDRMGDIEIWMPYGGKNFLFSSSMPFQEEVIRLLPRIRSEAQPIRWKLSDTGKISISAASEEEEMGEINRISGMVQADEKGWMAGRKKSSRGQVKRADRPTRPEDFGVWMASSSIRLRPGGTVLCTARKGEKVRDFTLIAYSTDDGIQHELEQARTRVGLVALVFLAMALAASRMLAARFLIPVKDLTEGVEALRDRRFSHRIPIRNDDELGRLSQTFNGMAEGLKELEVARLVQESFFPAVPLERFGWTVAGSCQPASRVGGDYLDFFPIGEDRIGLVIGDVSGHGVGAALVVGMAKALMASPAMVHEPASILDRMQRVFFATLKRKKMMSCCVVMFEPGTGRLWSANAGHNLPYLVRADGRVEQLKAGGKPLGTKNKPFTVQEERLGPDDWLFMYTDGFIEAARIGGGEIGYDRVGEALPALRREDAGATEAQLRAWFAAQAAPGPQADDITVLVLSRKNEK